LCEANEHPITPIFVIRHPGEGRDPGP